MVGSVHFWMCRPIARNVVFDMLGPIRGVAKFCLGIVPFSNSNEFVTVLRHTPNFFRSVTNRPNGTVRQSYGTDSESMNRQVGCGYVVRVDEVEQRRGSGAAGQTANDRGEVWPKRIAGPQQENKKVERGRLTPRMKIRQLSVPASAIGLAQRRRGSETADCAGASPKNDCRERHQRPARVAVRQAELKRRNRGRTAVNIAPIADAQRSNEAMNRRMTGSGSDHGKHDRQAGDERQPDNTRRSGDARRRPV